MSLHKELIFLILQFCNEEDLKKTAHMLQRETRIFFDMKYFEDLLLSGNWDESEKYLSGFIGVEDDKYSMKIYFEIRKQKFLEALDKHDPAKALDILLKDLKVFAASNEELYKEMAQLLTLDDFRKNSSLSTYGDMMSARKCMTDEVKNIIEANPIFLEKLKFPDISKSRLRRLINQGLNWQHIHCTYPQRDPSIETLFMDHQCPLPNQPCDQSLEIESLPSNASLATLLSFSGKSTSNASAVTQSIVWGRDLCIVAPTNLDATSNAAKVSDDTSNSKSTANLDEVTSPTTFPRINSSSDSELYIPDDLPKTVGQILNLESTPTSMDFHPVQQTFLLVGTSDGDIELWEVISGKKLLSRKFKENQAKEPLVSINRILWSPDGSFFGVAYSKHIVQLYSYRSGRKIWKQLEIDAHAGGVNDLAFSKPNKKLFVITCGDDKFIQVWDATGGAKQFTFEGHAAPVYSLCPHVKEKIHFLFSTSTNGEIKIWLYDNMGPRVGYHAPGNCCMRMAYGADGKRLFSCGTNEDGQSYIVEWDESEGYLRRTYIGLHKCSSGVVQFDTNENRFLAAGDDHLIKVWNIENNELLTTIDADGDLPATPYVRFSKHGTFLAVFSNHDRIKILANCYGLQLLQTTEDCSLNTSLSETLAINPISNAADVGPTSESFPTEGDTGSLEDGEQELPAEPNDTSEAQNFSSIYGPSQFQSLRIPFEEKIGKISRLIYTNAGNAILALTANGCVLFWKWANNENNSSGKATTKVVPRLWKPRSGLQMSNDLNGSNSDEVFPCLSLSKNDGYVVSASGATVSLFNLMTFKKIRSFMPPPPTATCIAFYPSDNNVIAVGMDDCTILIYNVRVNEVKCSLKGHSKRITGVAFSNAVNVLVSSGADAQIVVWNSIWWEKKKSIMLDIFVGWFPSEQSETYVQFHQDQLHFLVVHETQLAIYDTTKLKRVKQWIVGNFCARISHATFSCDSHLVFASFQDGTVLIFSGSDLHPQCEINPCAYLPADISSGIYPPVIAAHPKEPNQFALGLMEGGIIVIEPLESVGKWECRDELTTDH